MCVILFAHDCHPRYQLVVAANRDEFYKRPTLAAGFWHDNPDILAGRDLKEGGTWMGITTAGRFGALTNYRAPSSYMPGAKSRGLLVYEYLNSNMSPEKYVESLTEGIDEYNGFNLLAGNHESMYYYSNREKLARRVLPGIHGLSNGLLDEPWPKVREGMKMLAGILKDEDIKAESLFAVMANREMPDDQELPSTGVGIKMERILAPLFVMSSDYGTRLTTVILVERNHKVQFWERSFTQGRPDSWDEVYFTFQARV